MAPKARKASSDEFCKSHYEVAEILCQLPDLVAKFESTRKANPYWGCKRTRTVRESIRLTAAMEKNGPLTTSPDTPFGFCRKGSEEKLKHFKRNPSQKRKREDLSAELVNLNLERESLMAELPKLRLQCDALKVINLELKAKVLKSSVGVEKAKTHVDIAIKNSAADTSEILVDNQTVDIEIKNSTAKTSEILVDKQTIECQQDRLPSNENQTAGTSAQKSHYPSGQSNAFLDLNALPEEYSGMESWACPEIVERSISRMLAAEARQQRVKIRRVKNSIAFRKPQCISR